MSAWDAQGFLTSYGVPWEVQRKGWINCKCPVCDDSGMHGGFSISKGYYNCWRCGHHPLEQVISLFLRRPEREVMGIIKEFRKSVITGSIKQEYARKFELPGRELKPPHRKYLESRGFDPDELIRIWGIQATGPSERYFNMDWALRIIIPLFDQFGTIIGAQGRDITNKHKMRYTGTPLDQSLANYKETLYGAHLASGRSVIVVEGVFDAWKLGPGAVASFGTSMTPAQIKALQRWENIYFLFDPEPTAQSRARDYANQLSALGKNCELLALEDSSKDPGDLTRAEARELRMLLGF